MVRLLFLLLASAIGPDAFAGRLDQCDNVLCHVSSFLSQKDSIHLAGTNQRFHSVLLNSESYPPIEIEAWLAQKWKVTPVSQEKIKKVNQALGLLEKGSPLFRGIGKKVLDTYFQRDLEQAFQVAKTNRDTELLRELAQSPMASPSLLRRIYDCITGARRFLPHFLASTRPLDTSPFYREGSLALAGNKGTPISVLRKLCQEVLLKPSLNPADDFYRYSLFSSLVKNEASNIGIMKCISKVIAIAGYAPHNPPPGLGYPFPLQKDLRFQLKADFARHAISPYEEELFTSVLGFQNGPRKWHLLAAFADNEKLSIQGQNRILSELRTCKNKKMKAKILENLAARSRSLAGWTEILEIALETNWENSRIDILNGLALNSLAPLSELEKLKASVDGHEGEIQVLLNLSVHPNAPVEFQEELLEKMEQGQVQESLRTTVLQKLGRVSSFPHILNEILDITKGLTEERNRVLVFCAVARNPRMSHKFRFEFLEKVDAGLSNDENLELILIPLLANSPVKAAINSLQP